MTTALVLYCIGIIPMVKRGTVKRANVIRLAFASACDITGTIIMIVYAGSFTPADWHGWFGYCALLLMVINLIVVFSHLKKPQMSMKLRVYDICLLCIWLFSYSLGFIKL